MLLLFVIVSVMSCEDAIRDEFPIADRDLAIYEDAKRRYVEYASEIELNYRIPIVIRSFGDRCVNFLLKSEYSGGNATYCYEGNSDKYLRSEVED